VLEVVKAWSDLRQKTARIIRHRAETMKRPSMMP